MLLHCYRYSVIEKDFLEALLAKNLLLKYGFKNVYFTIANFVKIIKIYNITTYISMYMHLV